VLLSLGVLLLLEILVIRLYLLVVKVRNRSELLVSYLLLPLFLEHHIQVILSLVVSSGENFMWSSIKFKCTHAFNHFFGVFDIFIVILSCLSIVMRQMNLF